MDKYIQCKYCGKTFLYAKRTQRALCDECRKKAKQSSVVRQRTCCVCGVQFSGGPSSKYCPTCRVERQRERDREYKRTGPSRKLGQKYICERCGEKYILDGPKQRYCKSCAQIAVAENARVKKLEYQKEYDPHHTRRRARIDGTRLCVICGKSIPEDRKDHGICTCSDTCDVERRRILQNESDIRRGRRKISATDKHASAKPQSGVVGVTYRSGGKPWQATYKHRYLGVYDTVEEAAAAIEYYKQSLGGM